MPSATAPFAQKKFADINGRRMAYIDEGEGDAIVFQLGAALAALVRRLRA